MFAKTIILHIFGYQCLRVLLFAFSWGQTLYASSVEIISFFPLLSPAKDRLSVIYWTSQAVANFRSISYSKLLQYAYIQSSARIRPNALQPKGQLPMQRTFFFL